jgi:predicted alpha/beta-fold hydrolase
MFILWKKGMDERFEPKPWARNPHLQSVFASLKIRLRGTNPMVDASREHTVDGGAGVRLLGYHSAQPQGKSKGLVTLIHGWEGSSDSTYILSTGRYLFGKGYDIFRLNLRDHGNSHHLNRGLFHGALIEDTFTAVHNISALSNGLSCYLVGFSIGGNFALRIALHQAKRKITRLKKVFAISPPLDPYEATLSIDRGLAIYRQYFLGKWKKYLKKKQLIFPDLYDFNDVMNMKTCMDVTAAIMRYYPDYPDYRTYFRQYTLLGDAFAQLSMPAVIIASEDDPVVAVRHFHGLAKNEHLSLSIQKYGGHCGFLDPFPFGCWYERRIEAHLQGEKCS